MKTVKFKPKSDTVFSAGFDDNIIVWIRDIEDDDWVRADTLKGLIWIISIIEININMIIRNISFLSSS